MLKVCTVVLAHLGCSCVLQTELEGFAVLSYKERCAGQIRALKLLKAGSKYCPFLITIVSLAAVQTQHPQTFPIQQVPEIKRGKCNFLLSSLQQEQGPENDSWTLLNLEHRRFRAVWCAGHHSSPGELAELGVPGALSVKLALVWFCSRTGMLCRESKGLSLLRGSASSHPWQGWQRTNTSGGRWLCFENPATCLQVEEVRCLVG